MSSKRNAERKVEITGRGYLRVIASLLLSRATRITGHGVCLHEGYDEKDHRSFFDISPNIIGQHADVLSSWGLLFQQYHT